MGELTLATITTATFKKVCLKLLAEVLVDFSDGTFTLAKIIEVLIDNLPLLVFLETLLAEVFQKVDAELLFVEEAELLVEQLLEAAAADSLRLFHHGSVELSFTGISRMSVEIDSQPLPTAEPVGMRVADWGIEIEVERYAVARYFLFTKENFSAGIHCILKELKV